MTASLSANYFLDFFFAALFLGEATFCLLAFAAFPLEGFAFLRPNAASQPSANLEFDPTRMSDMTNYLRISSGFATWRPAGDHTSRLPSIAEFRWHL
jgi:hypothetical protein